MGPLHGLKILEIAGIGPGPFCAMLLADLGATVIRIERAGVDSFGQWLEWDLDGGVNFWETLGTGFGNGASVRCYRLQDAANQSLAFKDGLGDASGADHVAFLGEAKVSAPEKTPSMVFVVGLLAVLSLVSGLLVSSLLFWLARAQARARAAAEAASAAR